jgi:hypothetical protein
LVRLVDDLKSAMMLSGAFAIAGASSVPLLLPALPPATRALSLPTPVFCILLAIQLVVVYGFLDRGGLCGVSFGIVFPRRGIEGASLAHLVTDAIWHVGSRSLGA